MGASLGKLVGGNRNSNLTSDNVIDYLSPLAFISKLSVEEHKQSKNTNPLIIITCKCWSDTQQMSFSNGYFDTSVSRTSKNILIAICAEPERALLYF